MIQVLNIFTIKVLFSCMNEPIKQNYANKCFKSIILKKVLVNGTYGTGRIVAQ